MLNKFAPLLFVVLWILPVGWVGLMRSSYPFYPEWIGPLFRVSGVFESAPRQWRIFFIEIKGSTGWSCVDERSLFASTPLGDRTRFQQLMNRIEDSNSKDQIPRLLDWIAVHLPRSSTHSQIQAVRIIDYVIPSEIFFHYHSIADVYRAAVTNKMPRVVIATANIRV